VENKVASDEHDTQTERYQAALNRSVSRPGIYLSIYTLPRSRIAYMRAWTLHDAPQRILSSSTINTWRVMSLSPAAIRRRKISGGTLTNICLPSACRS
jgi:hypothetical protein